MPESNLSVKSLFNVDGIVAVVTGGGTGIGLMITKALVCNGAKRVYIIGRRKEVLEAAAQAVNEDENAAVDVVIPLPGDVTSVDSLLHIAEMVKSDMGLVNLVIANAGIMGPRPLKSSAGEATPSLTEYRAHALKTPMEEFTQTYAVNATGVYYTALAFLELLDAGNKAKNMGADWHSQVLATSSIGGFSRLKGASFAYNSSKAATTHLMKMLATSLSPYKIRCNILAPGIFPSDLAGGTLNMLGLKDEGVLDSSFVPAERAGREEDIAGAVLFLCSRAGAYVNGSVLVVDGGRLGTLVSTY